MLATSARLSTTTYRVSNLPVAATVLGKQSKLRAERAGEADAGRTCSQTHPAPAKE